jgi:hypothetical protein
VDVSIAIRRLSHAFGFDAADDCWKPSAIEENREHAATNAAETLRSDDLFIQVYPFDSELSLRCRYYLRSDPLPEFESRSH